MNARTLLNRCGAEEVDAQALRAYRSRFPVLTEHQAQRAVRQLLLQMTDTELLPPLRYVDLRTAVPMQIEQAEQPHVEFINEHYSVELDFLHTVHAGNASQAIWHWRRLFLRLDYFRNEIGYGMTPSTYRKASAEEL